MIDKSWQPITPQTAVVDAAAGLWVCVVDYLTPPFRIKITANGRWDWAPGRTCTADGDVSERAPADALLASAPLGALIGKIGGSSCDKGDWLAAGGAVSSSGLTRPVLFAIGISGVIIASGDEKTSVAGPLFLAMNDSPLRNRYHTGTLQIALFTAE